MSDFVCPISYSKPALPGDDAFFPEYYTNGLYVIFYMYVEPLLLTLWNNKLANGESETFDALTLVVCVIY